MWVRYAECETLEAQGAESKGGVLREEAVSPLPISGGRLSAVSSSSGVGGGAPENFEFGAF